jgi:hypothetical protein
LTVAAALLCCCGDTGPCGELPTALMMQWSGLARVEWNGQCPQPVGFRINGVVEVTSASVLLTLNETFCQYQSAGCPPIEFQEVTATACPPFTWTEPRQVATRKCIGITGYNPVLQQWTVSVLPLWGFDDQGPGWANSISWNVAKYRGPTGAPANDPRGVYTYDSGTFVAVLSDYGPPFNITVIEQYGTVTIS